MPDFPTLVQVLLQHVIIEATPDRVTCWCGEHYTNSIHHTEHAAAAWTRACVITTVEQLDALPAGAVVVTAEPDREDLFGYGSWTKCLPHGAYRTPLTWWWWAMDYPQDPADIPLPCRLVWHPDWAC